MPKFDWSLHSEHVESLRAMGCAVITISPEDIQALTMDDDDNYTMTDEQAEEWMHLHYDVVEEAVMGDYWSDTIRDLIAWYATQPKKAAS